MNYSDNGKRMAPMRATNIALLLLIFLSACATSDSTLRTAGKSEAYITGFHDGRHSGMKEAGNYLEHIVKDVRRFEEDTEYREGWIAGEAEGVRMQNDANIAVGTAGSKQTAKEIEKSKPDSKAIGRDVMKDTDTSNFKYLK
jgi:hypothetical protein